MIQITERAKQELKNILSSNTDKPEECLRLVAIDKESLGLGLDVEKPGDHQVEHEGSKVLLIEQNLAVILEGITLDVEETNEGPRLVIAAGTQE